MQNSGTIRLLELYLLFGLFCQCKVFNAIWFSRLHSMPGLLWPTPNFAKISFANAKSQYNSVSRIIFDIRSLLPMQNRNIIRTLELYSRRVSFANANFTVKSGLLDYFRFQISFADAIFHSIIQSPEL